MPAIDRAHGQYGQVMADPSGGVTAVQLVSLDKWDLDLGKAKQKITCFEDPNEIYAVGRPDIKGTFSGQYDHSVPGLIIFSMMTATVAPFFKLVPNRLFATQFFAGKGWVDGKISCDSNGACTTAGTLVAADAWVLPIAPA